MWPIPPLHKGGCRGGYKMKKTLITVAIVLLFTIFFIVIFHFTSGAANISIENTTEASSEVAGEDNGQSETPGSSDRDARSGVLGTPVPTDEGETGGETPPLQEGEEIPESAEEFDLKEYIKEKIVPVVVGVLTSASALLATLAAIKRSLSSIGETKEAFKKESKSREESFQKESELLAKKAEELERVASLVPKLQEEILVLERNTQSLIGECANLGKMISLGFSQDERVVSSGNGKKISKLLKSCQFLSSKGGELDNNGEEAQEEALI